ncbi:hypothetical protein [Xanthomonas bromi]|uniref:hypothetical protein n=1 Tax=Xanthomonas bromi TaxID=56449 RepID=UPI0011B0385B|nr:hypothetical protein [Xanthomonas bromi]
MSLKMASTQHRRQRYFALAASSDQADASSIRSGWRMDAFALTFQRLKNALQRQTTNPWIAPRQ